MKKKAEVDWGRVRELRRLAFESRNGYVFSDEETALLKAAIDNDLDRYRQIGNEVREDHWAWLPQNPYRDPE